VLARARLAGGAALAARTLAAIARLHGAPRNRAKLTAFLGG
jgi:hypothetical protein